MKLNSDYLIADNIDVPKARELQSIWCNRVTQIDEIGKVRTVAGLDVGFENNNTIAVGAVSVLSYPMLTPITHSVARRSVNFPYIPGYLSFREIPVLSDALLGLSIIPDLLLCDGQGIAHPRRYGIACHIGLLTGQPSIGVGKSKLLGKFEKPGNKKGDWSMLTDKDETIGAVVTTRDYTLPLYISTGHRIELPTAVDWVLRCCTRYKLPETTRSAHRLASG